MTAPDMRRNSRMVFLWCITASAALHAFLFAALPALVTYREPLEVRVLDVVLLYPKPLPTTMSKPEKASPAPKPAHSSNQTAERRPARQSKRAKLAKPAPPQSPAVEKPSAEVAPAVETSAHGLELKADAKPPAREAAATVPPVFNVAYLRNPPPQYPLVARRNGEQGTVTLKVLVTREGFPASVAVERTSGSPHLDEAAAETVRSWRFVPARRGNQPVEAWVLVPIVFRLEGAS